MRRLDLNKIEPLKSRAGLIGFFLLFTLVAAPSFSEEWNLQQATDYLDRRQAEWFAWERAAMEDGPCVSCHTGMTYLLVRPLIRQALGESGPTRFERGLLNYLRADIGARAPGRLQSVEVILTALFLAAQNTHAAKLSDEAQRAFDELWSVQVSTGPNRGSWDWYAVDLEPWETNDSRYYGSALAALAVGLAPAEYLESNDVTAHLNSLKAYLQTEFDSQPLHNRLAFLWASSELPEVLRSNTKQQLLEEVFQLQEADGGWSLGALGPWLARDPETIKPGSDAYATAYVTYVLHRSGVDAWLPQLGRAISWLRSHQNPSSGAWSAHSMNKMFPAGSMEIDFMQDAATAFATGAILLHESR